MYNKSATEIQVRDNLFSLGLTNTQKQQQHVYHV